MTSSQINIETEDQEQDQLFPNARLRDAEGAAAVQDTLPQETPDLDLDSEYDSRPNSELKDAESRPRSTDRMSSRTSSNEALQQLPVSGKRSYSIDDTVSDNLKVCEPFVRPKSPLPQKSIDVEDKKVKLSSSSSPVFGRQALKSTETYETELAFSQHFTQVFDESEFEIIKTNDPAAPQLNPIIETADLPTPDSTFNSESMEISQCDEFSIKSLASKVMEEQDDLLVG